MTQQEYTIVVKKINQYGLLHNQLENINKILAVDVDAIDIRFFNQKNEKWHTIRIDEIPGFAATLNSVLTYEQGRLQTEMSNLSLFDDGQTAPDGLEELPAKEESPSGGKKLCK